MSVSEANNLGYHEGIVMTKSLPYIVSEGCEVSYILKSLNECGDLSMLNTDNIGDFTQCMLKYLSKVDDPYKAFVLAFYDNSEADIYLPSETASLETTAWSMAENAFSYQNAMNNGSVENKVSIKAYDAAINLLKERWCGIDSYWKRIVNAYWVCSNQ